MHRNVFIPLVYNIGTTRYYMGFPGGSVVKNPPANAGDVGSILGLGKIPWKRKWQPSPVLLPRKSHGQRSLVGFSPWDRKESDTTERLSTAQHVADQQCCDSFR